MRHDLARLAALHHPSPCVETAVHQWLGVGVVLVVVVVVVLPLPLPLLVLCVLVVGAARVTAPLQQGSVP